MKKQNTFNTIPFQSTSDLNCIPSQENEYKIIMSSMFKHNISSSQYNKLQLERILYEKPSSLFRSYKEVLIYENTDERLSSYYSLSTISSLYPKILEYYNEFSLNIPIYPYYPVNNPYRIYYMYRKKVLEELEFGSVMSNYSSSSDLSKSNLDEKERKSRKDGKLKYSYIFKNCIEESRISKSKIDNLEVNEGNYVNNDRLELDYNQNIHENSLSIIKRRSTNTSLSFSRIVTEENFESSRKNSFFNLNVLLKGNKIQNNNEDNKNIQDTKSINIKLSHNKGHNLRHSYGNFNKVNLKMGLKSKEKTLISINKDKDKDKDKEKIKIQKTQLGTTTSIKVASSIALKTKPIINNKKIVNNKNQQVVQIVNQPNQPNQANQISNNGFQYKNKKIIKIDKPFKSNKLSTTNNKQNTNPTQNHINSNINTQTNPKIDNLNKNKNEKEENKACVKRNYISLLQSNTSINNNNLELNTQINLIFSTLSPKNKEKTEKLSECITPKTKLFQTHTKKLSSLTNEKSFSVSKLTSPSFKDLKAIDKLCLRKVTVENEDENEKQKAGLIHEKENRNKSSCKCNTSLMVGCMCNNKMTMKRHKTNMNKISKLSKDIMLCKENNKQVHKQSLNKVGQLKKA